MKLTYPSIHMNGTSAKSLIEGYVAGYEAIGQAIHALQNNAPHGRDYYPQGDEAYKKAREEHEARVSHLLAVQDEIQEICLHCYKWRTGNERI